MGTEQRSEQYHPDHRIFPGANIKSAYKPVLFVGNYAAKEINSIRAVVVDHFQYHFPGDPIAFYNLFNRIK